MRTINGIDVDVFTDAYLTAALWSTHVCLPVTEGELVDGCMDCPQDHPLHGISEDDSLDDHFDESAFSDQALLSAVADCTRFQEAHGDDLCDEDDERAGHDFWLTRNGHGAGFWDGDYEEEKGNRLTEACEACGELHAWVDEAGSLHFE